MFSFKRQMTSRFNLFAITIKFTIYVNENKNSMTDMTYAGHLKTVYQG